MIRPVASPKVAAAVRRAGKQLLQACRDAGTPVAEHSEVWPFDEAATIAKHLRPGDVLAAQAAYRMLVDAIAGDIRDHGCTYAEAPKLERALAEFVESHGYGYSKGKFTDDHARFLEVQQQETARREAKVREHKQIMARLEHNFLEGDPELKQLLAGARP